jgi:hypothetical protein
MPDQTDHDEQRFTQEYMEKYGIQNVRGGPWCKIDISESLPAIEHILKSSSDKCYTCGSTEHFTNKCPQKKGKQEKQPKQKKTLVKKPYPCKRCKRMGHTEDSCYATTYDNGRPIEEYYDIWGCEYCGKEFDSEKGCLFHENVHCPLKRRNKNFDGGRTLQEELFESSEEEDITCFRCGREGHYATTCYAKKHIKGYYLT